MTKELLVEPVTQFRRQLTAVWGSAIKDNYLLRVLLGTVDRILCLLTCPGSISGGSVALMNIPTLIRVANPLAKKTILTNTGYANAHITEAGSIVAVLSPGERRVLPTTGTLELRGYGVGATIRCETYQRCPCGDAVVGDLLPFDFAVIRYAWNEASGRDLDTRTAIIETGLEFDGRDVGWSRLGSVGDNYLVWGGDNTTPTGDEAVLVDFKKLVLDNPDLSEISIRLRSFWFGERNSGDFVIEFATYKDGEMSHVGFDFVNTGGSAVQLIQLERNAITQDAHNINGDEMATLVYNTLSQTATINAA